MKQFLKVLILPLLHLIRRIITVILNHAIPPLVLPMFPEVDPSLERVPLLSPSSPSNAFKYYKEDELRDSYNHFKKYFHDAIFLDEENIRKYAISEAVSNHNSNHFYLEFGVHSGGSTKLFSKILKDIKIYGFDSFEGLREDWVGNTLPKGGLNLNKKPPRVNDNFVPIVGWIQDTLPKFISENKDLKISFVHIDTDTYPTGKFILQQIKPYLINGAIIIFDELYDFPGWSVGEYKALIEVFKEEEYKFLAFAAKTGQAVIQYKKI